MINPFIKISEKGTKYVSQVSSLNKLVIKKLPLYGIEDEIEGKTAEEIFSVKTILKEIENKKIKFENIDNNHKANCIKELLQQTKSENELVAIEAENLFKQFGYRLGLIFLTLKLGEKQNQLERSDWTEKMWGYWANTKDVILVGGLAGGEIGEKLISYALNIFKKANIEPYNFILFENASTVGVMGCATKIKNENCTSLVLDFGHTNIKKSLVKKVDGEIQAVIDLPHIKSEYVDKEFLQENNNIEQAQKLHKFLLNTIANAYINESKTQELSNEIVISIANYVVDGKLDNVRGGYAKLALLTNNSEEIITEELSGVLKKKIKVTLIHDATAVAMYFQAYENAICVTIGTAFGVSFTGQKF